VAGVDRGVGAYRRDGGGWRCPPILGASRPAAPLGRGSTGGASPPSILVASAPPKRSSLLDCDARRRLHGRFADG